MTLRPLSHQEKNHVSELLDNLGFTTTKTPTELFRYSFEQDQIISLQVKYPVDMGVRLNIPFEICLFKNAFFLHPRLINNKVLEDINFLAQNLVHISKNLSLEQSIPIHLKQQEFLQLLTTFMPESHSNETERQWLSKTRISLMNKYSTFQNIEVQFHAKLTEALDVVGLYPTWKRPVSLSDGIPPNRKDSCIFYTNSEESEFLIVEKGYITYIRDFSKYHIQARCFFESYSLLLFHLIFQDTFSVHDLLISWIRFSRMTLNPIISVLDSDIINSQEYYDINLEKFLSQGEFGESAIPLPAISNEKLHKFQLYVPDQQIRKLLTKPPKSFEELQAGSLFENALESIKKGALPDAINIFGKILVILNRHHQRNGVVRVLFYLADIARDLNKFPDAISYLKNALEQCKSGEISMENIIQVHEKLGNIYLKMKQYNESKNHFEIIIDFLTNKDPTKYKAAILYIKLKLVRILVDLDHFKEANVLFKDIGRDGARFPNVITNYYLERANYSIKRDAVSSAIQYLKKGAQVKGASKKRLGLCHLELGKLYLYDRGSGYKARDYLEVADRLIGEEKIEDLFLKIKIYELLADSYSKIGEREKMKFVSGRLRQIRNVLQIRGVY
ncbi:MAG: tetratricopeptide repeat protein [Promethearchaeota archaeon]